MDHMGVIYGRIAKLCKEAGRWNRVYHKRVAYKGSGKSAIDAEIFAENISPWSRGFAGPTYTDPIASGAYRSSPWDEEDTIRYEVRWTCAFFLKSATKSHFSASIEKRCDSEDYYLVGRYSCIMSLNKHARSYKNDSEVTFTYRKSLNDPNSIPGLVKMSKKARKLLDTGCICDQEWHNHAYYIVFEV